MAVELATSSTEFVGNYIYEGPSASRIASIRLWAVNSWPWTELEWFTAESINMAPATMKQWIVEGKDKGFDGLSFGEAPIPKVGENEVLVKFQAASLNYRDLIIPKVRLRIIQ